jgi:transcriptional regulator NrdR family protein
MICIYSTNEATKVINSRANKKAPIVWRRRQGVTSGVTFTTYERPALAENKKITTSSGDYDTFNLGKLLLSIAASFTHNPHSAQYDSLWLAQTVEDALSMDDSTLTPAVIAETTHDTLKRFDELAAIQYAAKHHLITSVRRRGRPSLS